MTGTPAVPAKSCPKTRLRNAGTSALVCIWQEQTQVFGQAEANWLTLIATPSIWGLLFLHGCGFELRACACRFIFGGRRMTGSNRVFWSVKSLVVAVSICFMWFWNTFSILFSTIFEVNAGRRERLSIKSSRKRSWFSTSEFVKEDVIVVKFWRSTRMLIVSHLVCVLSAGILKTSGKPQTYFRHSLPKTNASTFQAQRRYPGRRSGYHLLLGEFVRLTRLPPGGQCWECSW